MTPRISKITDEINKTKGKIANLQEELPKLERKRTELENAEIIRLVRSSNVSPEEVAGVIASISTQGIVAHDRLEHPLKQNDSVLAEKLATDKVGDAPE